MSPSRDEMGSARAVIIHHTVIKAGWVVIGTAVQVIGI